MRLKALVTSVGIPLPARIEDFQVKGVTADSRMVKDGFIFVAIKGPNFDGHDFIKQAVLKGAKMVIAAKNINQPDNQLTYLRVKDTARVLADLSAAFWGNPASSMSLTGITGTNGKTTVSYLIETLLKHAGHRPAVIGTINYRFKENLALSQYLQRLILLVQIDGQILAVQSTHTFPCR